LKNLPCIADIQTTDLLYYDDQKIADCYSFCKGRNIDCLPVIGNPSTFFQRNKEAEEFDQNELTEDRWIHAYAFLFRPDLLERFKNQPIQFVFTHGELTGVVHFSDYNSSAVSIYLYDQIAKYERSLRQLAVLEKLENKDMRDYFESNSKEPRVKNKDRKFFEKRLNLYSSKQKEMLKVEEFQVFYLDDLIGLLEFRNVIQLDDSVVKLRDMIMHANSLIGMVDVHTDDLIYDIASFDRFFRRALALLSDSKRVHNRIAISKGDK